MKLTFETNVALKKYVKITNLRNNTDIKLTKGWTKMLSALTNGRLGSSYLEPIGLPTFHDFCFSFDNVFINLPGLYLIIYRLPDFKILFLT